MKRLAQTILCLLLAALVMIPVVSFAEAAVSVEAAEPAEAADEPADAEPALQLLWDIPFGIGIDEFISRVEEKTGFALAVEPVEADGIRRAVSLKSSGEHPLRIAGYDASEIYASFYEQEVRKNTDGKDESYYPESQAEALNWISIIWEIDEGATSEYFANYYAGILYDLEQKYGEAKALSMSYDGKDGQTTQCRIERQGAYIDTADIIKALDNQERGFKVEAVFHNMRLICYSIAAWRPIGLSFDDSPYIIKNTSPDPLPTYEETLLTQTYGIGF